MMYAHYIAACFFWEETMYRTQILLEQVQHHFLADEARRQGKSKSALLRQLIDQYIESQRQLPLDRDPLWDMIGIARGGPDKISEDHDRYLTETRLRRMSPGGGEAGE